MLKSKQILSINIIQIMFDSSKYEPNWKEAELHGKAARVGFFDENSKDICHCCHQKTEKREIPLCENTKSLEFLGFGFPLFYMFIRNCIILLLLLIISNSLISLVTAVNDGTEYCKAHPPSPHQAKVSQHHFLRATHFNAEGGNKLYLSRKCENLMLMIARTEKVTNIYENTLRICSFVIHVLALLYIKDKINKTWAYYDQMESDLSDYTVIIKNIPHGTGVRGKLEDFVRGEVDENNKPFEIQEIILIPNIEEVEEAHEKYEHCLEHYLQAKYHKEPHLQHHIKELESAESHKLGVVEETIDKINRDAIDSNDAIIIFETQAQKEYFLAQAEHYEESGKIRKYFNTGPSDSLIIEEAPEPREIIYQNLQYSHDRVKNLLIGWGLSLLFLLAITVVFYFLQLIKTNNLVAAIEAKEENPNSPEAATSKTIATIIAWVTLLGIVFFNKFVMGNVLHYFTHLEKHDDKAHEDFSFAFKYALGMFFTTALMTIAVEALKFNNFYLHDFGVIEEETIMFLLCAFLVPLIWTIHPLQLCHQHARNHHYGHMHVTQHEANHLMADYHYDMGKRYAELIQMMWFTFLYADLIPIGAFVILVGFCIYYWVDKYNLLRRSSLEGNISGDLTMKCLFLLDLTLFWRFLGELIFDIQIRDGAKVLTLIFLGLSIVYMLIPWEHVLELVNSENFKLNEKRYSDEKHRFQADNYKIYHPVYSELITKEHQKGEQIHIDVNDIFLHARHLEQKQKAQTNNQPNPNNSSLPFIPQPYAPFNPIINPNSSFNPSFNPNPYNPSFNSNLRPSVKITYK